MVTLVKPLEPVLLPDGRGTSRRHEIATQAIQYMQEHPDVALDMNTLVHYLQTTHRTLHLGFIEAVGVSPIAYARYLRLTHARKDLLRKTWPTVTETAMHWNFQHLGRFSRDYRQAFGEPPSSTIRRDA